MTQELRDRAKKLTSTIAKHAPPGYDPGDDNLTVPFAIKLGEQDAEIARLRAAIGKALPSIHTSPAFAESLLKDALEQKANDNG